MRIEQQISELGEKYWEGRENFFIRYWTYLDRGLEMFNKFKYYIGFPLMAAAFIPFLEGKTIWLVALTIIGLPILIIAGRYQLHKISKTTQYVNTISGDIFQFEPLKLQILLVKIMKAIAEKQGVDVKKIEEELNN